MSCCCYCQGSKWCASFGCPGLNKDEKLRHVGVEYSPVSSSPGTPVTSGPDCSKSPKFQHAFMQPGSQISLPPQMGLSPGNENSIIQQQPVAAQGAPQLQRDSIIRFSLHHDVMRSKLTVRLRCASNLPREYDRNGLLQCDSFVTLHLEPDRGDTLWSKVVEDTCDPTFNQRFLFGDFSVEEIKHQTLVLQIYNSALNNKVIGEVSLPLADVDLFGVVMQNMLIRSKEIKVNELNLALLKCAFCKNKQVWNGSSLILRAGHPKLIDAPSYDIIISHVYCNVQGHGSKNSGSEGDLHISLSYSPLSCKLEGIIHRATGLRKYDRFGLSDPFVKVGITVKKKTMFDWNSSVKRKTLAPEYNESFSYEVTNDMRMGMDMKNVMITLNIYHHNRLKPNDKMGCVNIGKHASTRLGRQHWNDVLKSPQQRISYWHPIQPPIAVRSRGSSPIPSELY